MGDLKFDHEYKLKSVSTAERKITNPILRHIVFRKDCLLYKYIYDCIVKKENESMSYTEEVEIHTDVEVYLMRKFICTVEKIYFNEDDETWTINIYSPYGNCAIAFDNDKDATQLKNLILEYIYS